jgi:hypothetical protein
MSLPGGKAIYLIAFSLPLVLYTQTHRPACHPSSLLFICVNILYEHLFLSNPFLYLCTVLKNNVHFKFLSVWKSITCVLFNQR